MAKPFLSVIIPAWNEAERLPLALIDIDKHLSGAKYTYEILVLNDGSNDNTAEIVRRMSRVIENLKLIDNQENSGKGAMVKQGMLLAKGNIRLFTDADNSTSIDHFDDMLPLFKKGAEVVIASRAHKESSYDPPPPIVRRLFGGMRNLLARSLILSDIKDAQCGFKAFTEDSAEKIFSLTKISGWGFDIEALALAKKFGYGISEIPIVWENDYYSGIKTSHYLQTLFEMVKIRWWLRDFERNYSPKGYEKIL